MSPCSNTRGWGHAGLPAFTERVPPTPGLDGCGRFAMSQADADCCCAQEPLYLDTNVVNARAANLRVHQGRRTINELVGCLDFIVAKIDARRHEGFRFPVLAVSQDR